MDVIIKYFSALETRIKECKSKAPSDNLRCVVAENENASLFGSQSQKQVLQAPENENDANDAMREQLACWGIGKTKRHKAFVEAAVNEAIISFRGESLQSSQHEISSDIIPYDPSHAIRFLSNHFLRRLTDDGKRLKIKSTRDKVQKKFGENISDAPYLKKNGQRVLSGTYREFKGI